MSRVVAPRVATARIAAYRDKIYSNGSAPQLDLRAFISVKSSGRKDVALAYEGDVRRCVGIVRFDTSAGRCEWLTFTIIH